MNMKRVNCLCLVIGLVLMLSGCDIRRFEMYGMPRYESKECYYDEEGFQDYADFCKYYYNETTIKKFETHSKFKIVTESDIEVIRGYFEDFELWAEEMYYYENYDFDYITQIKEGDYYYIYVDPNYNTFEYGYYDVYYVDMTKQILYFVHVNI